MGLPLERSVPGVPAGAVASSIVIGALLGGHRARTLPRKQQDGTDRRASEWQSAARLFATPCVLTW
jgi:hypothetical protein